MRRASAASACAWSPRLAANSPAHLNRLAHANPQGQNAARLRQAGQRLVKFPQARVEQMHRRGSVARRTDFAGRDGE
jgi:hypothetical protein